MRTGTQVASPVHTGLMQRARAGLLTDYVISRAPCKIDAYAVFLRAHWVMWCGCGQCGVALTWKGGALCCCAQCSLVQGVINARVCTLCCKVGKGVEEIGL